MLLHIRKFSLTMIKWCYLKQTKTKQTNKQVHKCLFDSPATTVISLASLNSDPCVNTISTDPLLCAIKKLPPPLVAKSISQAVCSRQEGILKKHPERRNHFCWKPFLRFALKSCISLVILTSNVSQSEILAQRCEI